MPKSFAFGQKRRYKGKPRGRHAVKAHSDLEIRERQAELNAVCEPSPSTSTCAGEEWEFTIDDIDEQGIPKTRTLSSSTLSIPPNPLHPPSITICHQQKDDHVESSQGNNVSVISHLQESDFNSLVDLIKYQRCCGCNGANLSLEINGSWRETGISPQLLDKISKAVSNKNTSDINTNTVIN